MKPIATPVYRLTKDYIWNSFLNSHKKHLIITGSRGSGKTTIFKALNFHKLPGITTWAIPQQSVYLKDNTTLETVQIATFQPSLQRCERRMQLLEDHFQSCGIPILQKALASDSKWVSIDEIGFLEAQSSDYLKMIFEVMKHKQLVAIVRKQNIAHLNQICDRDDVFVVDLDEPFQKIGCIIMASGLGKRFGENKLLTRFHHQPLIQYALDTTSNINQRIVVTRHQEIETLCRQQNIDVILHQQPYRNDTIRFGLEALLDTTHCIFCSGDQPLLTKETIVKLIQCVIAYPNKIIRPICDGTIGSPVIFPQSLYNELLHLPQGKGGGYVIQQHPELIHYVEIDDPNELKDIDTKEDFDTLQSIKKHKP